MAVPHMNRFLAPTHYTKHEAGQVGCTVFQVFSVTEPGIEPSLPDLVACTQPTVPLSLLRKWLLTFFKVASTRMEVSSN